MIKAFILGVLLLFSSAVDAAVSGTAFFINNSGYIATVAHVVNGNTVFVIRYHGKFVPAYVVAVDRYNDVAILKTGIKGNRFLTFTNDLNYVNPITLYGYPVPDDLGTNMKVTKGNGWLVGLSIHSNAVTCPGNSGSPIVNNYGNVVGVLKGAYTNSIFDKKTRCAVHGFGPLSNPVVQLASRYNIPIYFNYNVTPVSSSRITGDMVVLIEAW